MLEEETDGEGWSEGRVVVVPASQLVVVSGRAMEVLLTDLLEGGLQVMHPQVMRVGIGLGGVRAGGEGQVESQHHWGRAGKMAGLALCCNKARPLILRP